jgi:hypothetical protein
MAAQLQKKTTTSQLDRMVCFRQMGEAPSSCETGFSKNDLFAIPGNVKKWLCLPEFATNGTNLFSRGHLPVAMST